MNRKISEMKAFTRVQWLSNYYPELGVAGLGIISIVHIILIWLLKNQSSPGHALSEVNELLPEFEVELVRFPFENHAGWDERPIQAIVNASMESWIDVIPMGGGFIAVDDFEKKSKERSSLHLPKAINTPDPDPRTGYGISVFHQLHCLHALHTSFNHAIIKRPSLKDFGRDRLEHFYHCVDYVRRALMCAADTALEGQSSGTTKPATKGEGSYHLCRDYDAIKAFALDHRLTDMVVGQGEH